MTVRNDLVNGKSSMIMSSTSEKFHFILSHELQDRIRIRIGSIENEQTSSTTTTTTVHDNLSSNHSLFVSNIHSLHSSESYVQCQIFSDGHLLCPVVQTTSKLFTTKWEWNEWIILPLRYCDLTRQSVLALSIFEILPSNQVRLVSSTTLSLFDTDGTYRRGIYDLKLWPNIPPDVKLNSSTPGKVDSIKQQDNGNNLPNPNTSNPSRTIISTASLSYAPPPTPPPQGTGKPLNIGWNDDSAYPMLDELSRLAKLVKHQRDTPMTHQDALDSWTLSKARTIFDRDRFSSNKTIFLTVEFAQVLINNNESIVLYFEPNCNAILNYPIGFTDLAVYDPELDLENLDENKHLKLSRSARRALDKDLKPSGEQREKFVQILAYPPGQILSSEEQDLLWKYRYFLSQHKKALAKFLQCVHWDREEEVKQALELSQDWVSLDTEDALELLGPTYQHPKIRAYAVTRLRQTSDEDLILYLLQLVQALRYERLDGSVMENGANHSSTSTDTEIDLASFLIERACGKVLVANYLYWYASVECENNASSKDKPIQDLYQSFVNRLLIILKTKNERTHQVYLAIDAQKRFVEKLIELSNMIKRTTGLSQSKEKKLRQWLLEGEESPIKYNFLRFDPIPLPLDPDIEIQGIIAEKVQIFPSAKLSVLLVFETTRGDEYPIIFKNGDDLRQDQLVLQIITLMDRILQKENIDLKLTSYKVLSTSLKYGFVQYIPSQPLRRVLERHRTIRQYLQSKVTNDENSALPAHVLDAYVKSCAGYCVVTYLLGVGDRHLDNLLLRDSGQLFHIDFGFIMGRDPKPLPQAMRVSKDMMEMLNDDLFLDFLRHCSTAFLILRRHANVFANLFSLMLDANIPDIALERDKTVKKFLDKFRLDLDDDKAISYLKDLIDSSISAIVPQVYEYFHKLLLAFR